MTPLSCLIERLPFYGDYQGGTAEYIYLLFRPLFPYRNKGFFIFVNFQHEVINMKDQIKQIRIDAEEAIKSATSEQEIEALRIRFLGKKGELTAI